MHIATRGEKNQVVMYLPYWYDSNTASLTVYIEVTANERLWLTTFRY